MTVKVTVSTLRMQRRLKEISEAMPARAAQELDASASDLRDQARANAPRRTGRLERSIVIANTEKEIRAQANEAAQDQARDVPPKRKRQDLKRAIGTALFYAKWVHFGRKDPAEPANQFLFQAHEQERPKLLQRLRRAAKEEARKF